MVLNRVQTAQLALYGAGDVAGLGAVCVRERKEANASRNVRTNAERSASMPLNGGCRTIAGDGNPHAEEVDSQRRTKFGTVNGGSRDRVVQSELVGVAWTSTHRRLRVGIRDVDAPVQASPTLVPARGAEMDVVVARPAEARHEFRVVTFSKPAYCNVCEGLLWGLSNQGDG